MTYGAIICLTIIFALVKLLYPDNYSVQYKCSISDNAVILTKDRNGQPGGSINVIKNIDEEWQGFQSINLSDIKKDITEIKVALNSNYLCIAGTSIHNQQDYTILVFYKNSNGKYQFKHEISGEYAGCVESAFAITDDDLLLCGNPIKKEYGVVSCWDLNCDPPVLIQLLTPPDGESFGSGFGRMIKLAGDMLCINDCSAVFSINEQHQYGLLEKDQSSVYINGVRSPPCRATILAYKREGRKWDFDIDLYRLLPHPKGGVLRNEDGHIEKFLYSMFSPEVFWTTNNAIYLRGLQKYYVFKIRNSGWHYEGSVIPPFLLSKPRVQKGSKIFFPIELISIDEKYTLRLCENSKLEIYLTEKLSDWDVLWSINILDYFKSSINNQQVYFKIHNSQMILYNSSTKMFELHIFEINSQGPNLLFSINH